VGDSREERVFRMWINSLNIEGVYVNNLFADSSDGVMLLKVIDYVASGSVNWRKVNIEPTSRFKKVENGNLVIEVCNALKLTMINIGGLDVVDGNKKLILAIIWQLMRKYTLQVLENLARKEGVEAMTDEIVIKWANEKVAASGQTTRMRNFKDTNLKNSRFFLELVFALEPRAVDWNMVNNNMDHDAYMSNAKYVISSARKIGACVFLTPEDIVEVKSKMIMTFVSAMWTSMLNR
jgi:plastin-1